MQSTIPRGEIENAADACRRHFNLPPYMQCLLYRNSWKYRRSRWNQKERVKYGIFLSCYQQFMTDQRKMRKLKIYHLMSDIIKTKNRKQCKKHHYLMIKNQKTITKIIKSIADFHKHYKFDHIWRKCFKNIKKIFETNKRYLKTIISMQQEKLHTYTLSNMKSQVIRQPFSTVNGENRIIDNFFINRLQKSQNRFQSQQKEFQTKSTAINYQLQDDYANTIPIMQIVNEKEVLFINITSQYHFKHPNQNLFDTIPEEELYEDRERTKLSLLGKVIFQSQIKKVQLQRERHFTNINRLMSQMNHQKLMVIYYQAVIKQMQLIIDINQETLI